MKTPSLLKLVDICQEQSRLVRIGQDLPRLVETCQDLSQLISQNWSILFDCILKYGKLHVHNITSIYRKNWQIHSNNGSQDWLYSRILFGDFGIRCWIRWISWIRIFWSSDQREDESSGDFEFKNQEKGHSVLHHESVGRVPEICSITKVRQLS